MTIFLSTRITILYPVQYYGTNQMSINIQDWKFLRNKYTVLLTFLLPMSNRTGWSHQQISHKNPINYTSSKSCELWNGLKSMTKTTSSCALLCIDKLEEIHRFLSDKKWCVTSQWIIYVLGITLQEVAAWLQNILCDKN